MSRKGNLKVTDSNEDEDKCTPLKIFFGIFNTLFWLISVGIVGLTLWQIVGASTSFTTGKADFAYGLLITSVVAFAACIVGFLASLYDHLNLAGSYVVMVTLLIFTEGGLLLGCYGKYQTGIAVVEQIWSESNPFLLEATEANLGCCGFSSWNDTYSTQADIPIACVNSADSSIFTDGCGQAIVDYFLSPKVYPVLVVLLIIPALIQVLSLITGGIFLSTLLRSTKEDSSSQRTHSRNTVVPVMVNPANPTTKGAKSVLSGGDVSVNVGSPAQQSQQGNEALFTVAGVMLED